MWAISSGFVRNDIIESERLVCEAFGMKLKNPLGLAAGFDKNGVAISEWRALGFGFAEVGTVTPLPQAGNPRPRIFRLEEDQALINRLGFNNVGAVSVTKAMETARPELPIGVNIGKNAATPLDSSADDYATSFDALRKYADYIVINVSSPNTPGLRDLQQIKRLEQIIERLQAIEAKKPLFVKVSPDQPDNEIIEIANLSRERELAGIVATNTTVMRQELMSSNSHQAGGLSGKPLAARACAICSLIRTAVGNDFQIIGVGGIFTGGDLFERLRSGADVCQIYTALIYRGPRAPVLILAELLARMEKEKLDTVAAIRR